MEAVEEILMNATEEELAVLIGYCDAIQVGANYKAKLDPKPKKEKVTVLISTLQGFAKSFFLSNLEYDQIVAKVAKRMDISINDHEPTDYVEAKIAGKFVTSNFSNIPEAQKREMVEILKCGPIKNSKLQLVADDLILAKASSAAAMYQILAWLANAVRQSYLENHGDAWEANGRVSRIFRNLLGGNALRRALILPVIHISMLRYKYRSKAKMKTS